MLNVFIKKLLGRNLLLLLLFQIVEGIVWEMLLIILNL